MIRRRVTEVLRVLHDAGNEPTYSWAEDPSGACHAEILIEGGFLKGETKTVAPVRSLDSEDRVVRRTDASRVPGRYVHVSGCTFAGLDLVEELANEADLAEAMDFAERVFNDRENLVIVRERLRHVRAKLVAEKA